MTAGAAGYFSLLAAAVANVLFLSAKSGKAAGPWDGLLSWNAWGWWEHDLFVAELIVWLGCLAAGIAALSVQNRTKRATKRWILVRKAIEKVRLLAGWVKSRFSGKRESAHTQFGATAERVEHAPAVTPASAAPAFMAPRATAALVCGTLFSPLMHPPFPRRRSKLTQPSQPRTYEWLAWYSLAVCLWVFLLNVIASAVCGYFFGHGTDRVEEAIYFNLWWAVKLNGPKLVIAAVLIWAYFWLSRLPLIAGWKRFVCVLAFAYFNGAGLLTVAGTIQYMTVLAFDGYPRLQVFFVLPVEVLFGWYVGLIVAFAACEYTRSNVGQKLISHGLLASGVALLLAFNLTFIDIDLPHYNAVVARFLTHVLAIPIFGWGIGMALSGRTLEPIREWAAGIAPLGLDSLAPCALDPTDLIQRGDFSQGDPSVRYHILFVGAHPDDIELGAFFLATQEVVPKSFIVFSHGEVGAARAKDARRVRVEDVWTRVEEAIDSATKLGARKTIVASLPDTKLFKHKDAMVSILRDFRSNLVNGYDHKDVELVVVTHGPFDLHSDHFAVYEAVRAAARPNTPVLHMVIQASAPSAAEELARKTDTAYFIEGDQTKITKIRDHLSNCFPTQVARGTIDLDKVCRDLGTAAVCRQFFLLSSDVPPLPTEFMDLLNIGTRSETT